MSTTELKSNIHTLIDNTNDSIILNLIFSLLSKFKKSKSKNVVLSVAEKKAVDEAFKSLESGKVFNHETVMEEMKKKYPSLIK